MAKKKENTTYKEKDIEQLVARVKELDVIVNEERSKINELTNEEFKLKEENVNLHDQIRDLEELLKAREKADMELCGENKKLSCSIAAYKASATKYRQQIEHLKQLDKEGDEMYNESLLKLDEKDKVIRGLQSQIAELTKKYTDKKNEAAQLNIELADAQSEVVRWREKNKHWWKRIF